MKIFFALPLLFISLASSSQYKLYRTVENVEFYTKWGHEKWWSRKSDDVLLVKVCNPNDVAVNFDLGLEVTTDLQLNEESKTNNYCIGAHKNLKPRRNGIIYKPTKGKPTDPDVLELTGLEVQLLDKKKCAESN